MLEYVRKEVHSNVSFDHAKIATAIQEHDPGAAEEAMQEHIENLIRDVRRYWNIVESNGK